MTISVGSTLPEATLLQMGANGPEGIALSSDREALKTGHARRRAVHVDMAQGCLF